MAQIREQGAAGEELAEELLLRRGYRILGRQVVRHYAIALDGHLVDVELRADFLVSRDRRRFVAEAKTGRLAPRLDTATTRRQLLEYRLMFDVQGVLLVDAEAARVHEVVFPLQAGTRRPRDASNRLGWLLGGMVMGVLLTTVVWPRLATSSLWSSPSASPKTRAVKPTP